MISSIFLNAIIALSYLKIMPTICPNGPSTFPVNIMAAIIPPIDVSPSIAIYTPTIIIAILAACEIKAVKVLFNCDKNCNFSLRYVVWIRA